MELGRLMLRASTHIYSWYADEYRFSIWKADEVKWFLGAAGCVNTTSEPWSGHDAHAIPMFVDEITNLDWIYVSFLSIKILELAKKNGWSNHHLYRLNMVESPWIHVFIGWIIILSWWNHHFCWTSSPKAPSPEVLNRHIRPLLECLSAEMWPLQVSLNWRYSLDGLEGKSAPETMDSPHEKWLGLSGFKVSLKPTHGFTI